MIKKDEEILNVIFSSDDNYAQHLGVAIYSLLKQNTNFEQIQIFVIDNDITEKNKNNILEILKDFSYARIIWIDFNMWKEKLRLNMLWDISISTYARIFIGSMLPKEIERALYLDCDMIVCQNLKEFWKTNLHSAILGAVQDTISDVTKIAVEKKPSEPYFNAGMLLIDLKQWREQNVEQRCLKFLEKKNGSVVHHDQGILNAVLADKWYRVPLEYNLMTINYMFTQNQIKRFFGDHSEFYSKEEVEVALKTPKIMHFTPSFTSRPWIKNCKHPYKKLYWDELKQTAWKNAKPQKDESKWYVRVINWRYRNLPY